jgi:hypothetical protein
MESTSTSSDRSDQDVDAGSEVQAAGMVEIRRISVITQAAAMEEIRSTSVITEVDVAAAATHDAGYVQLQVLEEVDHQPAPCCINVDASCTDVATDVAACASSASNRSSYSSTSSRCCR